MSTHIWLRAETKPAEERTALPPKHARQLMDAGFQLTVESSSQSAFRPQEYEAVGCKLVDEHQWKTAAPQDAVILGLKELEESGQELRHRHIHFAHVYKEQAGWQQTLSRFVSGGGTLYDLEFLVDESGRRVAAFGYWAGFAGAAVAAMAWANHSCGCSPVLDALQSRPNQQTLVNEIKSAITACNRQPTALVVGALGRCGRGAVEFFESVGVDVTKWDLEETKRGGPFEEIIDVDMFLNCVFINNAIPPFLTTELLQQPQRKLSVICDISCDPYGDYNPLPIYNKCTSFDQPVESIDAGEAPLHLVAIDHLPSLLPRESSEDFCDQLMPHLLQLDQLNQGVWQRAEKLFKNKTSGLVLDPEN